MASVKLKGSTKRFGTRYGRTSKAKVDKIEAQSSAKYKCPYCGAQKVRRSMAGIWNCTKCKKTFSGRAYTIN